MAYVEERKIELRFYTIYFIYSVITAGGGRGSEAGSDIGSDAGSGVDSGVGSGSGIGVGSGVGSITGATGSVTTGSLGEVMTSGSIGTTSDGITGDAVCVISTTSV